MNKEEYINRIKDRLNNIMNNKIIHNFKSQMYSVYIGAEIAKTYDEGYLWKNAMFLSSNSVILLEQDIADILALRCIKFSAEIYELFSKVSEKYDREYSNIMSALCYDIAGYQANAMCVLKSQDQYSINSYFCENFNEIADLDNYVLIHIQNILLKKIPKAQGNYNAVYDGVGYTIFNHAIEALYNNILNGEKLAYEKLMKKATLYFHKVGNAYISQILHLMNVRLKMYTERSVRNNLNKYIDLDNNIWNKYVKLLSYDLYNSHSVKNINDRTSIFELWQSQLKALNEGLLGQENSSFVVQMPTSAGKTFIAELLILKKLIEQPNKKIIYIAPYRALRNEKELELGKNLSKLGYTVSTISGSYEVDELHQSIVDTTNVLIATPEKIDLMLRLDKDLFRNLSLLVVDEGHMIGNLYELNFPLVIEESKLNEEILKNINEEEKRLINKYYYINKHKFHLSYNVNCIESEENILYKLFVRLGIIEYEIDERANLLEFLIVRLLYINDSLQVLFLSAVMPKSNSKDLSRWLGGSEEKVIDGCDEFDKIWEPTRKIFGNIAVNKQSKTMSIQYPQIKLDNKSAFVPNIVSEEIIKYRKLETNRINTFKFPDFNKKSDICAAVAIKFIEKKLGNCLIFAAQPKNVLAIAGSFAQYFKIIETSESKQSGKKLYNTESNESYYHAKRLYGDDNEISICLKHGIGIHYGKMYEAVRKAVEEDFKNNKLNCLVATNTVGQGLNFPIKNIIIHSVDINPVINKYLSVRDFWNVAGRAGRAGKETEGQVLFVTVKDRDYAISNYYTDISNIEIVESSYLNVINDMAKKRITDATFVNKTDLLTEPFLLDLLTEEYYSSDDAIIDKLCNKSLVKVQIDNDEVMKDILYDGLYDSIVRIRKELPDLNTIKKYSKTGFHIKGNKIIDNFINTNLLKITIILTTDDYKSLLKLYIDLLYFNEINELIINRDYDISIINKDDFIDIMFEWISGKPLKELKKKWEAIVENKCNIKFEEFVEVGLSYRYPWGMTALLEQILSVFTSIKATAIPNIMNLATFIKCGVDDIFGCYLSSLGMKNRITVKNICNIFRKNVTKHGYDEFIRWIININLDELEQLELNTYDYKDFVEIISNLSKRNMYTNNLSDYSKIVFNIKGVDFNEKRKKISKKIRMSDKLTYRRDYTNDFDPYLILFYYNDELIGSLPSEFSMYIATEIDLNDSKYSITINEITRYYDYNNINITMKLIN